MNFFTSQITQRKSALKAGILAGLASPGSIGAAIEYPRPQGSDLGRLRGDVNRIGRDFSSIMNRENGNKKYLEVKGVDSYPQYPQAFGDTFNT